MHHLAGRMGTNIPVNTFWSRCQDHVRRADPEGTATMQRDQEVEGPAGGDHQQPEMTDHPYYASYQDLDVHRTMMEDDSRVEAYRVAIERNNHLFQGKVVLDVGAGLGILSLLSASAGARRVYAVEASSTASILKEIVSKNGFEAVVEVINSRVEDATLPEKADVIVSEWMGIYLLHESMLSSVLYARDNLLVPDGHLFPSEARLFACPVSLPSIYSTSVHFWSSKLYGFDFTPVQPHALAAIINGPQITQIFPDDRLAEPTLILDWDLYKVTPAEVGGIHDTKFVSALKAGKLQGLCVWFECIFPGGHLLSTSPNQKITHWKQVALVLPATVLVEEGEVIGWQLDLKQSSEDSRKYDIGLTMLDPETEIHPIPCDCGVAKCVIIKAYMEQTEDLCDDEIVDITQ